MSAITSIPIPTAPMIAPSPRPSVISATHLAAQSVLLNVLSVPAMAFIIRRLGETRYGQWSTAASLVATASVLTNLGLRGMFVRSVARAPHEARQRLAHQLGTRLLLSLFAAGAVIAACVLLRYPAVVLQCAAMGASGICLSAIATTLADLLQGLGRISVYALTNFIAGLVLTLASVIVIAAGRGPVALSLAYVVGPLVSVLLLWFYTSRQLFSVRMALNFRRGRTLIADSRFYAAQQFINTLSVNEESLLLPRAVGSAGFGLFSAGQLLASRLSIIPDSLGSAFYPAIAQAYERDRQRASDLVTRFLLLSLAMCLPVTIGALSLAAPVAHVLFPTNPLTCQRVIRITIWVLPLMAIENVMGYALNAIGKDAQQARANFVSAILSVLLALLLIVRFGIVGACAAMLFRTAVKIAMIAKPFDSAFSSRLVAGPFIKVGLCTLAMAFVLFLTNHFMPALSGADARPVNVMGWLTLLLGWGCFGLIGMAIYALSLWALRVLSLGDLAQLVRRGKGAAAP